MHTSTQNVKLDYDTTIGEVRLDLQIITRDICRDIKTLEEAGTPDQQSLH